MPFAAWILVGCLVLSDLPSATAAAPANPSARVELTIAHRILHAGVVAGFNGIIADYQRLHPDVTVRQIRVPDRIWYSWLRTQLVGGAPPDLLMIDGGFSDESRARYLRPLTEEVQQPNPYNAGSALESLPWRQTFCDGLMGTEATSPMMGQTYGVTTSFATYRVFCNLDLLQEITGSTTLPRDFDGLLGLCSQAEAYGKSHQRIISGFAASGMHGKLLTRLLFRNQVYTLDNAIDVQRRHDILATSAAQALLLGKWSPADPAPRSGYALIREMTRHFPVGYEMLGREDGIFWFTQGRALMLFSGSWEADTLQRQSPFRVGIFAFPLPGPQHPRYGEFAAGRISEAGLASEGTFGITCASRHPAQALDFLRFATSQSVNARFTARCQRLSPLRGVEPEAWLQPFRPDTEGTPPPMSPDFEDLAGHNLNRVYSTTLDALVSPAGSVDAFLREFVPQVRSAARADLEQEARALDPVIEDYDLLVAAELLAGRPDRLSTLWENRNEAVNRCSDFRRTLKLAAP